LLTLAAAECLSDLLCSLWLTDSFAASVRFRRARRNSMFGPSINAENDISVHSP